MTDFSLVAHPSIREAIPLFSSTRPVLAASGTIANATTTGALTLGKAGLYRILVSSQGTTAGAPHVIYVRDSGGTSNRFAYACPVAGAMTEYFRTVEASLQITLRNDNSSGTINYAIMQVD